MRDVIDSLDHEELVKIKKDLEAGGLHLKSFVQQKIKEKQKEHERYCATCANRIDPYSTTSFTLVFGSRRMGTRLSPWR